MYNSFIIKEQLEKIFAPIIFIQLDNYQVSDVPVEPGEEVLGDLTDILIATHAYINQKRQSGVRLTEAMKIIHNDAERKIKQQRELAAINDEFELYKHFFLGQLAMQYPIKNEKHTIRDLRAGNKVVSHEKKQKKEVIRVYSEAHLHMMNL